MGIVSHLAVHLLGLAVAGGLVLLAALRPAAGADRAIPDVARPAVLVGAGLLVASHLIVGGLLADPDGWPLLLRAAGYAGLALAAAGGRLRAVPAVALLPTALPVAAALPLAAGLAGVAAAAAVARGVLGRGRDVWLLSAGIALYAFADAAVWWAPSWAAASSVAGSIAAGWWVLARAARRSLAGRVSGASLVLLLLAVLLVATGSGLVVASDVQAEQRQRLLAVAEAQAADLVDRGGASLEATASALAGASLVEPLVAEDVALAEDRIARILALPDVDLAVLTDADGQVVARTRRDGALGPAAGLAVAGTDAAASALDGQLDRGVADLGDGTLAVLGAVPVAPLDDAGQPVLLQQAGALVVGRIVTATAVVERIAADTASDVAIVVAGRSVARAGTGADDGEVAFGDDRVVASAPLGDPPRGELVLALPAATAADATDAATRQTFALAALGLLLVGSVATVLGRRTAAPVVTLTAAAEQVAAGDLTVRTAPRVTGDDEVARLARAFDDMTGSLEARDAQLRGALREQAALRSELEAIQRSMGESLLATDADGRITSANRAAREAFAAAAPLEGRPLEDVLAGRAEGGAPLPLALGAADDPPIAVRGELRRTGRIVEVSAAPLRAEGRAAGRVHVVRDITDRVLADRVRTELIANLSHELNTPLTPIKAFLEVLAAREVLDERFVPMLELAREGRQRLERTIGALVDLAELEAGRYRLQLQPVDVRDAVGALLDRWRDQAPGRSVTRRVGRDLPPALTDPALLDRALDEVVDNAVKFADGAVRVTAGHGTLDREGAVWIRVRDDGPGIPAERTGELFELFVQADGSATREAGGLGIGLPIARRMVEACGGVLDLGAAPGGGTEVTITLPASASVPAAPTAVLAGGAT